MFQTQKVRRYDKFRKSFVYISEVDIPEWAFREIRVVLLGRTGVGKSSTGNTLLDRYSFETEESFTSITTKCQKATKKCPMDSRATLKTKRLTIVDTPGFFDTKVQRHELAQEISRCVSLTTPGPHVFLYVLDKSNRYTPEEAESVNEFFNIFGSEAANYMILLFTHVSSKSETSLQSSLQKAPEDLIDLVEKCQHRVFGIDNKTGDESERRLQMDTILAGIESLIAENRGEFYTNEMYEENLRRLIEEQNKIEKEFAERQDQMIETIETKVKGKYENEVENNRNKIQLQMKEELDRELEKLKQQHLSERMKDQENIKRQIQSDLQQKYDEKFKAEILKLRDKVREEVKQELKKRSDALKTEEETKIKNIQANDVIQSLKSKFAFIIYDRETWIYSYRYLCLCINSELDLVLLQYYYNNGS